MKLHFRLKIALFSLTLSGSLLIGFGIAFSIYTYRSGMERMDRAIRALIEARFRGPRPPGFWQNLDDSLQFIYGDSPYQRMAIQIVDAEGQELFSSENTPPEISSLPQPELPPLPAGEERASFRPPFPRGEAPPPFDGRRGRQHRRGSPGEGRRQQYMERVLNPHLVGVTQFHILDSSQGRWRVAVYRDEQVTASIALHMNAFYVELKGFNTAFLISIPLTIILLGIVGWVLASRAMRPIARIAETAEAMTARDLHQRIPDTGSDVELSRLTHVINSMLDRLELSYHQAVRFSADAAHELQTPLTVLQGELDVAIQSTESGSEEQQRYGGLLSDLSHLKSVVQKLLLLAHADEGRLKIQCEPVELNELVDDALEDLDIMAPNISVSTELQKLDPVEGDSNLLQQLITNLTSNAAKYTSAKGEIQLKLSETENEIRLTIRNTSDPLPEEDIPLLFTRFHRVDKSRNRAIAGSGLGLSLAREIARAHNGELVFDGYADGMVSFSMILNR